MHLPPAGLSASQGRVPVQTGPLEPTNEPYAIAKIAGIELCEAFNRQYGTRFLSVMPTNLYGPGNNYDLENSHVLPAFIGKYHPAKLASRDDWQAIQKDGLMYGPIPPDIIMNLAAISRAARHSVPESYEQRSATVTSSLSAQLSVLSPESSALILWGTGTPRREFLYSDDLADACLFLMRKTESFFLEPKASAGTRRLFDIGYGEDLPIRDLALTVKHIVGYDGPVEWDHTKPDGTPKKLLDVGRMKNMGWQPNTPLEAGIRSAYRDYLNKTG